MFAHGREVLSVLMSSEPAAAGVLPSAEAFGCRFLADLGIKGALKGSGDHPALAWRRAGLMAITGRRNGPGLVCPAPLAAAADGALLALKTITPRTRVFRSAVHWCWESVRA